MNASRIHIGWLCYVACIKIAYRVEGVDVTVEADLPSIIATYDNNSTGRCSETGTECSVDGGSQLTLKASMTMIN